MKVRLISSDNADCEECPLGEYVQPPSWLHEMNFGHAGSCPVVLCHPHAMEFLNLLVERLGKSLPALYFEDVAYDA